MYADTKKNKFGNELYSGIANAHRTALYCKKLKVSFFLQKK